MSRSIKWLVFSNVIQSIIGILQSILMAKYQSMNDFSNSMVFVFAISILISLLTNTTRVCSSSDENVKVMNLNWFYFNSLLILFSGFIVYLYMSFNSVDYFYELYTIIFFSFFINVSQMIIAKINLELRLFYIFIIEGVSSLLSFILFMVVLFSEDSSSAIFLSKAIYVLLVFLLSIFIIVFYFKFTYKLRGSTYQDFKKYITITCDQVVNMLGGYFDKFIIGFLLGKEFFAIYKLTGDLVLFIFSRISMIISRYLLPLFKSNIKDRFETNKLLIASFKWVSLLGFPPLLGIAAIRYDLQKLVGLTDVDYFPYLVLLFTISTLIRTISLILSPYILAKDLYSYSLYWNVLKSIISCSLIIFSYYIFSSWQSVVFAFILSNIINLFTLIVVFLRGESLKLYIDLFKSVFIYSIPSAVMFAFTSISQSSFINSQLYFSIIASVLIGFISFFSTMFLFFRRDLKVVFKELGGKF